MKTRANAALTVTGLLLGLGLGLSTNAAGLDLGPRDPALRAGASLQPDQFHLGFQVALGPERAVRFRPSLDLAAGNGVRIASLNGDLVFPLGRKEAGIRPYLGAGPGLNLIDVTSGVGEARGVEAKLVGHALVGVLWGRPPLGLRTLGLELRGGLGDTPDFKATLMIWF